MITRRGFIRNTFAGVGAGLFLKSGQSSAKDGGRIRRTGLQLYTVRKELKEDFDGTLRRVAAVGFREVEFAGYFDRTPGQVKKALSDSGLKSPSAHVDLKTLSGELGSAIDDAAVIGHRYLVLAYLSPGERQTADDYRRLAALLNRAGEACRKAGLRLAYHNHDFEFAILDGQVPYDLLLRETDAGLVKLELDLYWISKAGRWPEEYFDKYPGRFELFHVKDMDGTPSRSFTEVGRGTIDFRRIFGRAGQAGVKHYFVEQDETPGPPLESARISYEYLRGLRF